MENMRKRFAIVDKQKGKELEIWNTYGMGKGRASNNYDDCNFVLVILKILIAITSISGHTWSQHRDLLLIRKRYPFQ